MQLRCSPMHAQRLHHAPSSSSRPLGLCAHPLTPAHHAVTRPHYKRTHQPLSSATSPSAPSAQPEQPSSSGAPHQRASSSEASSSQEIPELPPYGKLFVAASLPFLHALAAVLGLLGRAVDAVRNAVATMFPQLEGVSRQVSTDGWQQH